MKFFPFFLWLGQSEIKINVSKCIFQRLGQNRSEAKKPHCLFCLAKNHLGRLKSVSLPK